MSDTVMTTDREALKSAIIYMEKALSAFKKGLNLDTETENEKINTAPEAVETAKAAQTEAAQKVEVPYFCYSSCSSWSPAQTEAAQKVEAPKKEPEKPAVSIEEVRKVFAKIMLDQIIDGKALIKATLDKYKVTKVSEFKPEQYLSALDDTVESYKKELEKKDPQNADEKLKEMIKWVIPF